ncbi:MAG: glycosyltransferase [Flavobacteriales bacterium]
MSGPVVSIIIPSFRSAATISGALKSAAQQTISHEILLIDGSGDQDTRNAVAAAGVIPDAWISEPDSGVYDAINKGIARSRGEWIYVLGADDELAAPDVFERVLACREQNTRLLLGNVSNIERVHAGVPEVHKSRLTSRIFLYNTVHQQGALYHRSLFDRAAFNTSYKILGDYDFHLALFAERVPWKYTDVSVSRCRAGGLSKQFVKSLYLEELAIKRARKTPLRALTWLKYIYKKITSLL